MTEVTDSEIEKLFQKLNREAEASGYHLNPDRAFVNDLLRGLLTNGKRYGYWACPCRRASKVKSEDLDIICPCDYRDPDLQEHGMCYCSLYVSGAVLRGEIQAHSIPERRPPKESRTMSEPKPFSPGSPLPLPVLRCKVCGYLCAREQPPEKCPICKADRDRFEVFIR
jgi:ferredoxin-thioredoxin reductase catalytic subunit